MLKKRISILLIIAIVVCSTFTSTPEVVDASTGYSSYYNSFIKNLKKLGNLFGSSNEEETTVIVETESAIVEEETASKIEEVTTEKITEETTVEEITEEEIITEETTQEYEEITTQEDVTEEIIEEITTEETEEKIEESVQEEEITYIEEITTQEMGLDNKKEEEISEDIDVIISEDKTELYEKIEYYEEFAAQEAEWLWSQQMSNGAFAFYNAENGTIRVNPYFSEIVAIALINYDDSQEAMEKIKAYIDWHFAHINTAEIDYNGLAGTIYDYTAVVENGIVVSETTEQTYDSTDSYSALFIKVLADYVKVYGDKEYIVEHKELVKDITNVLFANLSSNGYTYAKPDYKMRYLMDNSEVYAGLVSAEYIYSNVIEDSEMLEKITNAVSFFDENFDSHWWKGDHYAPTLSSAYEEHSEFSWDNLYPNATAQMFPIIYDVVDAESENAQILYEGLCNSWDWQDMDYISEGITVFCWGNFALLGAKMNDVERFDAYMNKYKEIVDEGRLYPLYSSEAAMVLMGCNEMIDNLNEKVGN